jgi:hypothetical protein
VSHLLVCEGSISVAYLDGSTEVAIGFELKPKTREKLGGTKMGTATVRIALDEQNRDA